MRFDKQLLIMVVGGALLCGCYVERPRRRVVVIGPPPPPVEVVPVAPGPEFVYAPGIYVREGDGWGWHHGYWHRR